MQLVSVFNIKMSFVRPCLRIVERRRWNFAVLSRLLLHPVVVEKARTPVRLLLLPAAMGIVRAASPEKTDLTSLKHTIQQADNLFDSNKFQELYDLLLPYKDCDQVDLLWRFARATYKLSLQDSSRAKELLLEGYEASKRSLQLDDNSAPAHKWMSIVMDAHNTAVSFRERCKSIVAIKEHMKRSLELDPKDATVWYMRGTWCYEIADLPWYKYKILCSVGGVAPDASYEEALECYEKAEEADPNFYSLNHLMLGKTYLKLGKDKDKAISYLKKAAEVPALTEDDRRARKEAADILKTLM